MSSSVVANTCRITVISATLRADLAVPVQIPVAELLATLIGGLGREAADEGAAEGGWVLQRAAEPPLDPSATLAASQIRDGDVLHLRTRTTQLPEIAFDDVLDAVATGVLSETSRWKDPNTATGTILFAAASLVVAFASTLVTGPAWTAPSIVLGVVAVLLLGVAAGLRPVHRGAALVSAAFAIAYAAACGATAVGGTEHVYQFGAPQLLLAACLGLFAAVVAVVLLGIGIAGFVTVISAGVLIAIGTAIASGTTLSGNGTAALVAAVALVVAPLLPTLSFRMARLPLPSIPNDAADLRRDTTSVDSAAVLRQAFVADQFLTGLLGGVAVSVGGAAALLATGGISERILSVILGLICLLRARLFTGRGQRWVLIGSGALALFAGVVVRAGDLTGTGRLIGVAVPAAVVAVAFLALAVALPGRRWAPPWARSADLLESLLVLSVVPLALAVVGVYGAIRVATNTG